MAFIRKHIPRKDERGNAMIYVLIAVALFAALAFVLSRGSGTSEQGMLSDQRTGVAANQIMQVSQQVKQGVDQMLYSGSGIGDLDFCLPSDACFGAGPFLHKVFHPDGGGLVMPRIPEDAVHQVDADPAPGWYMGRVNNVEWTDSTATDVLLVAHQIRQDVCAAINESLTGSAAIPALTVNINKALIYASAHSNGPNIDLDAAICPGCDGKAALCVVNSAGTIWSFYNIIAQR